MNLYSDCYIPLHEAIHSVHKNSFESVKLLLEAGGRCQSKKL